MKPEKTARPRQGSGASSDPPRVLLLTLIFSSGVAGLGYQVTWVRLFSAGLGHEVPAIVSVTLAFLGGIALGAWILDRRIAASTRPNRWVASLEFVIAGWGCVSALLIPSINTLALQLLGPVPSTAWHWTIVFALPFFTLLPSTVAMGGTLPAMEQWLRLVSNQTKCIGAVYSANTGGAVIGTLAATFFLMPTLGLPGALFAFAAINAVVALAALRLTRFNQPAKAAPAPKPEPGTGLSTSRLHVTVFATGFLGIAFELIGIRGLAQVLENTAYTYAAVLAVFLAGIAGGAAMFQRFLRQRPLRNTVNSLLCCLTGSWLLTGWAFLGAPRVYPQLRALLGDSIPAVMAAEVAVAGVVLGLPALAMGAMFSALLQGGRRADGGIGRMAAWNTLGCCAAVIAVTLWILPGIGLRHSTLLLALGYLPLLTLDWRKEWWKPLAPIALAFFFPPTLQLLRVPDRAAILAQREGVMASAAVVKTSDGHRSLRVNNRLQMGGTSSALAQRREAHLPLLLHPDPHTALFLGPGTGITLGAAAAYPGVRVDAVELLPEVVALMQYFAPENREPFPWTNIHLQVADARRFIRTTTNRYDVIVADLFHPAQDGAGFLYTKNHFNAVRQRLSDSGIFCQWLPLHQLDASTLRIITRTFTDVFSQTTAILLHFNVDIPVLGLIGARGSFELDPGNLDLRLKDAQLRATLRGVGLDKSINVLGCFAGGPAFVESFGRDAVVATDRNPAVLFSAPRRAIRRDVSPHATLLQWLGDGAALRRELSQSAPMQRDPAYARQVGDFLAARDIYLRGLVVEDSGDLSQAIDVYLESSRQSLYFIPAYARMVTIIQAMAQTDRVRARALWRRLETARPDQPLGRQLLGPLLEENAPAALQE